MSSDFKKEVVHDPSGFVLLSDLVPGIVQEIRYFSTYNFIGERIDGYEEPCALLTKEAARALKSVSNEMMVQGYRLKVFDAYRPVCAVKHFVLWGIEDQDIRMKEYFYPELEKQELFAKGYIAKLSGHSMVRIIFTDILPYIASYVVMAMILQISSGILSEAQLSILGLGPATTKTSTLGLMMQWAMTYSAHTNGSWWAYFPVVLVIALISFSLNLMNTGLDQVFNPQLRD